MGWVFECVCDVLLHWCSLQKCHSCLFSQKTISSRCPASSCSTWWTGPVGAWRPSVCGYVCVCVRQDSSNMCSECFIRARTTQSICFLYLTVPFWDFHGIPIKMFFLKRFNYKEQSGENIWLENPTSCQTNSWARFKTVDPNPCDFPSWTKK